MRTILYGVALTLALALAGCSSGSSDAPSTRNAHPEGWVKTHGKEALKSPNFVDCQVCHGRDLHGAPGIPSCYSASIGAQSCHAGGPNIPHPLDGTYFAASAHGKDAKRDLLSCQSCHGQPGGPGSNPHFNIGINDFRNTGLVANPGHGCEGCHVASAGKWLAHPKDWAGPNNTFHYSVPQTVIDTNCTLCHGAGLQGGVGVNCLSCHAEKDHFTLNCLACHGYPPTGAADDYIPLGVNHRNVSAVSAHNVCVTCHGVKENENGGYFAAVTGYRLFDKATDTLGDHWNGRINMNSDTGYNPAGFGCDTALCHGGSAPFALSDSQLTVAFGSYDGIVVPHPVGPAFLAPTGHGPAAKGLTAAFPNGLLDCQPCHATSGTNPPRFNLGILSAGGTGCEGCHGERLAHPKDWAGPNQTFHYTAKNIPASCAPCHGEQLNGISGYGVSCLECHASVTSFTLDCTACHSYPPNGNPEKFIPSGVDHLDVTEVQYHAECVICHGMNQTSAGGWFNPAKGYALFNKATNTNGDHWDGKITMSAEVGYNPDTFGCASCHGDIPGRRLSDSGLPVNSKNVFERGLP